MWIDYMCCHKEKMMKKRIWLPQTIIIVMLLWTLCPVNTYAYYYTILHWACCGIFVYLAIHAFARKIQGWPWILGTVAVFYNPIFSLHLTGENWFVVNSVTICIAVTSIFVLRHGRQIRWEGDYWGIGLIF